MATSEYRIDGNRWFADFKIGTADDNSAGDPWSKVAIRAMTIEENIFEPFSRGTVTLIDPENLLEAGFLTRGDGDDTVSLKFWPEPDSPGNDTGKKGDFKLVINGESNSVSRSDRLNNLKTYELLDANYFKLNEPIPYGQRFRGLIGDILLRIFEKFEIPVGDFDSGAHEIDIFPEHILPPTSFRYSDLVKYLVRINYNEVGEGASAASKTYVRSLLYLDRTPEKPEYVFKSLEKIYDKPTCHESFVAGEFPDGQPNANNTGGEKGPVYYISQLHSTGLTTPMLTYSNTYFMNFLVSGYDPQLGEHGLREIRIEDVKKKWSDLLIKNKFTTLGGSATPFMPLNTAKKQELFRTFSLPFQLDKVAKLAEAEMIGNMTFYNMELTLHQLGDVERRVGVFIDVENLAKASNTDAKLCGRWLVTKCTHEFMNNSYYNTLFCTKVYTGPGAESGSRVENINNDC